MTNTRRWALSALLAGALYFAGHGQAQTSGGAYGGQFQQAAQNLLNSPAAQALSGAGLTAVKLMAGTISVSAPALTHVSQDLLPVTPGPNVLVNNPGLDSYSFFDVSSQSETAVAGFGGNILVAYNASTGFLFGRSGMAWSVSTDGGNTFNQLGYLPVTPSGFNGGDPGLTVNWAGVFYASAIAYDFNVPPASQGGAGIWKSTNGGVSWTGPVYSPPPVGSCTGCIGIGDKPFIAVDNSGKAYDGNVYVTWTAFGQTTGGTPIVFSRSTDGGNTFSTPIPVSSTGPFFNITQGSAPAVGPNGEVYVAWFQGACGGFGSIPSIFVSKSVDGGQTFGLPVFVAPLQPLGFGAGLSCGSIGGILNGNFRVNSFPRIDVNPNNGHVYIVYGSHSVPSADSGDVFFTSSTDGGQTWSIPLRVNDDAGSNDQFFPAVAVNGQGVIEVVWYDRRRDPNNLLIDVYSAKSTNDGVSFHSNQRVTTVSSPPAVGYDPILVGNYMGDYIDVKAMTGATSRGSQFLQAWGDFRRKIETFGGVRNNQDVRFFIDNDPPPSGGGGSGHD